MAEGFGIGRIECFSGGDMFPFPDVLRKYFPDYDNDDTQPLEEDDDDDWEEDEPEIV